MVKRKDSMAYMEFIRGKYDTSNTEYIKRLLKHMTKQEQSQIISEEFDTLWTNLWGSGRDTRSTEYYIAKENYNNIPRKRFVESSPTLFIDPEWGFPKGRRSKGETDLECAIREFWEETNIPPDAYEVVSNLSFTEIFVGTNDIKYKHTYFVAVMKDSSFLPNEKTLTPIQKREVSEVGWKTLLQSRIITRPHYIERKKILSHLDRIIQEYESV
jgi:8-oxo-dGTP pyrophosphatase MutT (NUDIX family)